MPHNIRVTVAALAGLKLPFQFDVALLQQDLALIAEEEWSPHYNARDFGGQWRGAALRSATGSPRDITAGHANQTAFRNTALLDRCDYFREVLAAFAWPLRSVRLLSLAPGSFIREHSDHALGFEDGEVRLHIPIRTNPGVEFYVCGERLQLDEGGCYYVNVNLPHRVNNRGPAARVHLVIDALVDSSLRALFEEYIAAGGEIPRSGLPPHGFDEFADLIFADENLREELRAIPDRAGLLRAIERIASDRGFEFNEADVEAAFRSRPPGSSAATFPNQAGWKPIRVSLDEVQPELPPRVTWMYAPDHRFTEPFFEDSVQACLRNPFSALFRREMPLRRATPVRPRGLIFHMSRCGSTLISRSFAAAESTLVMSEPAPLDDMLRTERPDWLEWIVSSLGDVSGSDAAYILKLDSWHIRSLPMFRAVFPEVPWIFVYRDPLEVLVSQLHQPGLHASPGAMDPAILGLCLEDVTMLTRQQWCVRVLEGFMTAALSSRSDPRGIFVNYHELPGAITGRIASHFGLEFAPADHARIEAAARLDAKQPWLEFAGDQEAKRRQAESLVQEPGLETLRNLYRQLNAAG